MKTVLANGCFDLFHYGHLLHLEAASLMGDLLVVSITDDAHVNKPGRPIFKAAQRARIVRALSCVDDVLIVPSLMTALERVKPDILVKGIDYREGIEPSHAEYCRAHNIEVRFTETPKFSATELIAKVVTKAVNEPLGR